MEDKPIVSPHDFGENSYEKSRAIVSYKSNAKPREIEWRLENDFAIFVMESPCVYCGKQGSNGDAGWHHNGIDRKDNNAGYVRGNVVPCCRWCNIMKGDRAYLEFMDHIYQIVDHQEIPLSWHYSDYEE